MPSNYSFVDDTIAGSAIPYEVEDLTKYYEDGITHIISLTPKLPLVSEYNEIKEINFYHFPIYATPDDKQIKSFVSLIKGVREKGEKAVVHCQYGQERTGIFLAVYLVEVMNMPLDDAIKEIQHSRDGSLQTHHALHFLKERYS